MLCGPFEVEMSSEAASTEVIQGLQQEVPMPPNSTLNYTRRKLEDLKMLLWQYEHNRSITSAWHYVFLVGYILVGVIAVLANGLVVLAVFRNKNVSNSTVINTYLLDNLLLIIILIVSINFFIHLPNLSYLAYFSLINNLNNTKIVLYILGLNFDLVNLDLVKYSI